MVEQWIKDTKYVKSVKLENLVKNKEEYELLQRLSSYLFTKCIKEVDGCLTIPVVEVQRLQNVLGKSYQTVYEKDRELF